MYTAGCGRGRCDVDAEADVDADADATLLTFDGGGGGGGGMLFSKVAGVGVGVEDFLCLATAAAALLMTPVELTVNKAPGGAAAAVNFVVNRRRCRFNGLPCDIVVPSSVLLLLLLLLSSCLRTPPLLLTTRAAMAIAMWSRFSSLVTTLSRPFPFVELFDLLEVLKFPIFTFSHKSGFWIDNT